MHSESIHRYRMPNSRLAITASWNISGMDDRGIDMRCWFRFVEVVVRGRTLPQQWLNAAYTVVSLFAIIRRRYSHQRQGA